MYLEIRQEAESDHAKVYEINTLAFRQENEAKLVDLLRQSEAFVPELSLVAMLDNELVGHILFSKIQIMDGSKKVLDSLALAPVAVKPGFQHQGIGGRLITAGLDRARALEFGSVIVLGHEQYYPKFGFEPASKWGIKAPFEAPANAFMGLELVAGGLKNAGGTVQYPKAFEMV